MIVFNNWTLTVTGLIARQYDNLSRRIDVEGDLPAGYTWQLLVQSGGNADTILLEATETGAGAVLTADNLSKAGEYYIQLRGVLEADGITRRHTNVVSAYIPESLTGLGTWPEVPTEFAQVEARILELYQHPPIPGSNGYWLVWDTDKDEYVESQLALPEAAAGGTSDHSKLKNRDAADQHPMSAITGLDAALAGKQAAGNYLTDKDLDTTFTVDGKAADAAAVGARLDSLSEEIGNKADKAGWTPDKYIGTDAEGNLVEKDAPAGGGTGTVTSVNGVSPDENGNVTVEVGQPTDEQIGTAVDKWLDEHPEATTTVQDGAVTTPKLADGAVTVEKISGMECIYQPFDPDDYWANGSYNWLNTETGAADKIGGDGWCSPFIGNIKPNQLYTFDFTHTERPTGNVPRTGIYYYDSDQNFLSYTRTADLINNQFTTPDNTAFIRFDTYNFTKWHAGVKVDTADWMLCEGDKLYDHYYVGVEGNWNSMFRDDSISGSKLQDESVDGGKLIPQTVPINGLQGVTVLMQLFNQEEYRNNGTPGAIKTDGGIVGGSGATYWCSNYVAAKSNQVYTCNWKPYTQAGSGTLACYDANKVFLGMVSLDDNKQFTTIDGTAYIRFGDYSGTSEEKSAGYMICEGETLFSGYQPGGEKVIVSGLLLDKCTPFNSVDGSILLKASIPRDRLAPTDGLKVCCYGDSLTQNKYPAKVAALLGAEVVDAGVGGNTINAICNRVGNYGTDFNVVTLMCGTNDNGGVTSCPLGTVDDEAATDDNATATSTTYVSRLKRLINKIKATHPGATYILMPPFEHAWSNYTDLVDMMRQVAELYSIPFLDIYHLCGWRGTDAADKAIFMVDQTHENDAGAQRIAELLAGFIKQLKGA